MNERKILLPTAVPLTGLAPFDSHTSAVLAAYPDGQHVFYSQHVGMQANLFMQKDGKPLKYFSSFRYTLA